MQVKLVLGLLSRSCVFIDKYICHGSCGFFPTRKQKFLTSKQEVRGYIQDVLWLISVRVFFTRVIKAGVKRALMDGLYLKAWGRVGSR